MDLELKIENLGPIDRATIHVGPFTVFAGPNDTGKTFVAKMLYSMLEARNANHALVSFSATTYGIKLGLQLLEHRGSRVAESLSAVIGRRLKRIESILRQTVPNHPSQNELDALKSVQPALMAELEEIRKQFQSLKRGQSQVLKKKEKELLALPSEIYDQLETAIDILANFFNNVSLMIPAGQKLKFRQNVHRNFQVSDLAELQGNGDSPLFFSVPSVGQLQGADFEPQVVQNTQALPATFYLESPLYWKLKSALESIKLDAHPHSLFGDSLHGVPAYFYDMAVALRRKRIDHPLASIHKRLHHAIGGQISLSEAGDLEFLKNGKSIPLSLTAAGTTNLGMLALLIERGILGRGSFLFIDEPESNLHSAWQVEMAAFLFELARQGVQVVISTHSMTILKWLEVQIKEKPENQALVKLNKFPPDDAWNDDIDAVMAEVKQSLTKPFSDLYIQGL